MPFSLEDSNWTQVRSFLEQHVKSRSLDSILAPNEFLEFFPGTYHYRVSQFLPPDHFDFVVFHKGMVADIYPPLALKVLNQFYPVFANAVFVVYSKRPLPDSSVPSDNDLEALLEQFEFENQRLANVLPTRETFAVVITTYNRPWCLERSLTRIMELGIPVVVVDDGSSPEHFRVNQQITSKRRIPLLRLPDHRQQPSAINVGVDYWLADPSIQWISVLRDNTEVRSNMLSVLAAVQDSEKRPLLTGWDDPDHPTVQSDTIASHSVLFKRSTSGFHLHAHRDYWASVIPIPTPQTSSNTTDERSAQQGTDEDWWITSWSPNSIVKRGGYVVCVPGLVTLFDTNAPTGYSIRTSTVSKSEQTSNEDSLSLDGVKVLVDGYNLQLTKGTGIKTYGLSLIQALDRMGANVDILLSRNGYKANDILDEIIFFDNQSSNQNWVNLTKWVIKSLSPFYRAKRRKSFAGFVVKRGQYTDDFLKYATSFNLPQCYDLANGLYQQLRLTTKVSVTEKIDIWHATYPLPMQVRGAKKITTIHDLIPLRLPYATLDDKKVFYLKIRDALKDSDVIISVSENSKQDILTYFDVDPDKIVVTYQPIALRSLDDSEEGVAKVLSRYGLKPQNYLLFVGAIEPKKNVGRLLDAYASLDTDMPLVIVGKKGWLWEDELGKASIFFDNKDSKKKVKLLEYVSAELLRYLYRGAFCLAFPSLYEGFGLPPVEAMHYGCPVITSNASCLPEICGDAALYVDPYDFKDILDKLELMLGNPDLRTQLIKEGHKQAERFSMDNYTKRLHQAYTQALR